MEHVDISLTLTFEELVVLLDILEVGALAGFNREPFKQISVHDQELIKSTAQRGLAARQYISREGDEWKIEPLVLTLLTACIMPTTTTIIVNNRSTEPSQVHYLHQVEEVTVVHTPQENGFYRFIWRRTPQPLLESALFILDLQGKSSIDSPEIIIPEEGLTKARDVAEQDQRQAQVILQNAGAVKETAVSLAHSLSTIRANTTIVHIRHEQNGVQDGFTILEADNGLWLIYPVEHMTIVEPICVKPITKLEAEKSVADLIR